MYASKSKGYIITNSQGPCYSVQVKNNDVRFKTRTISYVFIYINNHVLMRYFCLVHPHVGRSATVCINNLL